MIKLTNQIKTKDHATEQLFQRAKIVSKQFEPNVLPTKL